MPSQIPAKSTRVRHKWRQYLPKISDLFILIYFVFSFLMNGGLRPFRRGFFCGDTTIQYPFERDTISFPVLLVISLFIPWIVIKLLERQLVKIFNDCSPRPRSRSQHYENHSSPKSRAEEEDLMASNDRIKRRLVVNDDEEDATDMETCYSNMLDCDKQIGINLLAGGQRNSTDIRYEQSPKNMILGKAFSNVQIFLFGFATTSLLTGIGKMTCGRYRPHFMQRCQPNIDCTLKANMNRYIENYTCTNESLKPRDFAYVTTSWPSGHAAIVFYSMLYLIYYMNTVIPAIIHYRSLKRLESRTSPIVLYCIYVLMIGLATYVSLTRVSDYHHHPLDVLSGVIIGTLTAYAFAGHIFRQTIESVLPVVR